MELFNYLDKFLNLKTEIHSILDVDIDFTDFTPASILTNEKLSKAYTPIYLNSLYSKEISHFDAIFEHSSGFYIYFSRLDNSLNFKLKIIYKIHQYEEIKIYINQLKKIKQNGNK